MKCMSVAVQSFHLAQCEGRNTASVGGGGGGVNDDLEDQWTAESSSKDNIYCVEEPFQQFFDKLQKTFGA